MKAAGNKVSNHKELAERLDLLRQRRTVIEAELAATADNIEAVIRDPSVFIKENLQRLAADKHVRMDLMAIVLNWLSGKFTRSEGGFVSRLLKMLDGKQEKRSFFGELFTKIFSGK